MLSGNRNGLFISLPKKESNLAEQFSELDTDASGSHVTEFQFKKVLYATSGIQQHFEGGVDRRKVIFSGAIRVKRLAFSKVSLLQRILVDCGTPFDPEQGEIICHAEKLSPQEQ